ncbi:hypothetical protein PAMP_022890 [Pampus punctatissimus]
MAVEDEKGSVWVEEKRRALISRVKSISGWRVRSELSMLRSVCGSARCLKERLALAPRRALSLRGDFILSPLDMKLRPK